VKLTSSGKRLLTALLVAAAAWYLGRTIWVNWEELQKHTWQVSPARLALSVVLHLAVLAWGVWIWSRVLRSFSGATVAYPALLRIWSLSNLARYVPGKVWQFVAVAQLGRARGLSGALMLTSVLIHTGLSLLAAVLVGVFTLADVLFPQIAPMWLVVPAAIGSLLAVHPVVLNGVISTIPRMLGRPVIAWTGSWLAGVGLLIGSIFGWALYGVAYYFLLDSLTPVAATAVPLLAGVNAWSFVVGYLAFFSIAGLGARELAMTALLQPVAPAAVAALLAVASRLWTVAAELIFFNESAAADPGPHDDGGAGR
jgi:glycosyltransferase 2 family protein